MRVAFLGVTGWGNSALSRLLDSGVDVWRVFTRVEQAPCPHFEIENLAALGARRGCTVILDRTADDDPELLSDLEAAQIDVLVSAGFHRKILPPSIAAAKYAINIHPSLLPAYRGSAPPNWAIVNGEDETGVTLHDLTSRFDAGDIYIQQAIAIGESENAGQLRARLAELVADVLMRFVEVLRRGDVPSAIPQDESRATYYRPMTLADARVDPDAHVRTILNHIRGTTPWPGAWLEIDGVRRRILGARRVDLSRTAGAPDAGDGTSTIIAARDGVVRYEFATDVGPADARLRT